VGSIPKAFTPPGGYGAEMPPPILAGCTDPLVPGAPDLRGTWRVVHAVSGDGDPLPEGHPALTHVERIEQAGDRLVVTGGGVVHDMVVDGTHEHGVNDVMAADHATPISVAATFEDGALVLRPRDMPGVVVTRHLDGDQMVWSYAGVFLARLERMG
jgi:hypothetical protein